MKIAIIYDMIYPFNIGGLEIRNYEIAKRLIKKGHEVHLYGVKLWEGGDIIKKDGLILHGVCRYKNLYNINGKRTIFEPIKFAVKIFPELMKEKFDIIDNSSLPYLHCFTVALYAKIKKTPLLMTWQLYGGNYWYSYLGYKGFIGKITEKIVVKLTDNHLPASETTKKDLVNAGAKKVFVSYNGVDFKKINSAKRKNSNYDIIFVGRLCHQKNVCLLIESVALLKKDFPKLKIAIIGGGPDRKKLEKLSEKNGLKKNIDFIGPLRDLEEVYSYMKSGKIFVYPSLLEGFGIVVIEAMACGLPVITTDSPMNASKEFVEKEGFIVENDPEKFSRAIKKLLLDESLRNKMSGFSIEKSKNFDWDIITDKLEDYYKKISLKK